MAAPMMNRGFVSLLVTQFFGAANDNVLKTVLVFVVVDGLWSGRLGSGGQGIVSLCMFLPFVLFSGWGGQLADRYSKTWMTLVLKIAEVPIAIVALVGFWLPNMWIALVAMVLLAIQSAFFGPAKYGMIPELVRRNELSRANGVINMLTNIAVILGTYAAGVVATYYSSQPAPGAPAVAGNLWLPGVVLVGLAIVGLVSAFFLPRLEPGDRDLKWDWNPFRSYVVAVKDMAGGPLLTVALAWGYFYFISGLGLLIVPEYTIVFDITPEEAARLLGILAIAIGIGSVTAGMISGHAIEPRLVPIGALGLGVSFILLGFIATSFTAVAVLLFIAGLFAGFYIIPLQAMLQHLSPDDERGRFLGTANAISFAFLSASSLLFWLVRTANQKRGWFPEDEPHRMFLVCGVLMLAGAGYFIFRLRRTMAGRIVPAAPDGDSV